MICEGSMAQEIRKALIVDDSRLARLALSKQLQRREIESDAVASATEAVDYIGKQRPDVVFMDYMMPDMDGFEASARLLERSPDLPVVMYTSQDTPEDEVRAREYGICGFLPKPSTEEALTAALQAAAQHAARRERDDATVPPVAKAPSETEMRRWVSAIVTELMETERARLRETMERQLSAADVDGLREKAVADAVARAEETARETAEEAVATATGAAVYEHSQNAVRPLLEALRDDVRGQLERLGSSPELKTQVKGIMFEHLLPTLKDTLRPQLDAVVAERSEVLRGDLERAAEQRLAAQREEWLAANERLARRTTELEARLKRTASLAGLGVAAAIVIAVAAQVVSF